MKQEIDLFTYFAESMTEFLNSIILLIERKSNNCFELHDIEL